jgi:hypothetical protein
MTHKITDIVAVLHEMAIGDRPDVVEMVRRLVKRFPGITSEEVIRALAIRRDDAREEKREAEATYQREMKQFEEEMHIFEGMPENISLAEAAEIKASQGDPIAKRVLAELTLPATRLTEELYYAACVADPKNWHVDNTGYTTWLGGGDMPSESKMIEWFQINHPAEARRIEKEIMDR